MMRLFSLWNFLVWFLHLNLFFKFYLTWHASTCKPMRSHHATLHWRKEMCAAVGVVVNTDDSLASKKCSGVFEKKTRRVSFLFYSVPLPAKSPNENEWKFLFKKKKKVKMPYEKNRHKYYSEWDFFFVDILTWYFPVLRPDLNKIQKPDGINWVGAFFYFTS